MLLLDSSFLIAYHNTRDIHHAAAEQAMVRIVAGEWGRAALLEYVFLEVVTVLLARRGRAVASDVGATLLRAGEVDFILCSDFFLDTLETFRHQAKRNLSFTDSAIVTVALRNTPSFVATFDRDFRGIKGISVVPR